LIVVAGICVVGARTASRQDRFSYQPVTALASIALLSVLVPLMVSLVRPIYWPGRYTMIALPAFASALGCLMAGLASPALGMALAYCAILAVSAIQFHTRTKVFENSANVFAESESDKPAALQLCRTAEPGDTVAFTGLTRAGLEYYLRQYGCAKNFQLVSIPEDTANHLGWVRRAEPQELQSEVDGVAERFSQEGHDDSKLWLILGKGRGENDQLIERLNRQLGPGQRQSLYGSFFNEVLVYTRKAGSGTRTPPT
jgi:hypothetical protein